MKKIVLVLFSVSLLSVHADIVLKDLFDNGPLATAGSNDGQVNGGFKRIGDSADGIATESAGVVRLENNGGFSSYGILSNQDLDLSTPEVITTTWMIKQYSLKGFANSMSLTWQASGNYTLFPQARVTLDLNTGQLSFNVDEQMLGSVQVDSDFGNGDSSFTLVATFTKDNFTISSPSGMTMSGGSPVEMSGSWQGKRGVLNSEMHVGTVVNSFGIRGLELEVDSVIVNAVVPEPAVAGLLVAFGGGMVTYRRIFGRNTDPES